VNAITTLAEKQAFEAKTDSASLWSAQSLYEQLSETTTAFPDRPAVSFQIKSGPKDKTETLSWRALKGRVTQTANLFRTLGIGDEDVVAYILPNCNETAITLLAGATAGIVNPINPLLEPDQLTALLHETGAKVVVTLAPFPKSDLNATVMGAVKKCPQVHTVLEVDLMRYLTPPTSWIARLLRPKRVEGVSAKVLDFNTAIAAEPADALHFEETLGDRICAYFHTGGTTGMPKIAQHRASGILYNGWCGETYMFNEKDVLICPLPLFHVLAAYPVFMSCLVSGAHMVLPTPAGYRGDGVMENFWKLIERYGVTFMIMVPTAAAALMQRKVDADVSTLRSAICGSAPLPVELLRRFEEATGLHIFEGYGMTEATCLVAINPPGGERKIGSVGLPFAHSHIRILNCDAEGQVTSECGVDEVGEICVSNPGVSPQNTYTEAEKNRGLFADGTYLRTGDLGRLDADGYLFITGRAKDLIIRGGHNIDPAVIEDALIAHPDVAFVGAIGQPDAKTGEMPAAYVELREGASLSSDDLIAHAEDNIGERAARPKYVEVLGELPKTAVGKVFKPDLRRMAITRVFDEALASAGLGLRVERVIEDKKRGLVAQVATDGTNDASTKDEAAVRAALGTFPVPWDWAGEASDQA